MLPIAVAATKLMECLNPTHHLHHHYLKGMLKELPEELLKALLNGSILSALWSDQMARTSATCRRLGDPLEELKEGLLQRRT